MTMMAYGMGMNIMVCLVAQPMLSRVKEYRINKRRNSIDVLTTTARWRCCRAFAILD